MKAIIEGKDLYIIDETIQQGDLNHGDSILFTSNTGEREVYTYIGCAGYGMSATDAAGQLHTLSYSHCSKIVESFYGLTEIFLNLVPYGK